MLQQNKMTSVQKVTLQLFIIDMVVYLFSLSLFTMNVFIFIHLTPHLKWETLNNGMKICFVKAE